MYGAPVGTNGVTVSSRSSLSRRNFLKLDGNKVVIDSPESAAGLATERSMVTKSQTTFLNGDAVLCATDPTFTGCFRTPSSPR